LLLLVPVGLVYGITNIALFIRSRNWGYLVLTSSFLLMSAFAVSLAFHRSIDSSWSFFLGIALMISVGTILYLCLTHKLKWWSYEILELAALTVEDVREGYTTRPLPAGKIDYDRKTILQFARFMKQNLISIPIIEDDKVVFLITHTRFKLLTADHFYKEETYICFHDTGNVSVNIAREDYQKFRDSYAFDQLCQHLGKMFIGFYQDFRKGDKKKILNGLKTMFHQ
jgi:Rieske Fe-S protein